MGSVIGPRVSPLLESATSSAVAVAGAVVAAVMAVVAVVAVAAVGATAATANWACTAEPGVVRAVA